MGLRKGKCVWGKVGGKSQEQGKQTPAKPDHRGIDNLRIGRAGSLRGWPEEKWFPRSGPPIWNHSRQSFKDHIYRWLPNLYFHPIPFPWPSVDRLPYPFCFLNWHLRFNLPKTGLWNPVFPQIFTSWGLPISANDSSVPRFWRPASWEPRFPSPLSLTTGTSHI